MGRALNSEVSLLVEDRFDEWRGTSNQRQRGFSLRRDEPHAYGAVGAQRVGAKLARYNYESQRRCLLATQVAARRRVEAMSQNRCRV